MLAYGMQLPVQSQSKMYAEEWEETAGTSELVQIAQACDAAGFLYVAVCDHVAIPRSYAPRMGTTWYDTMTTLGFLAGLTSNVRLMSHVAVLPFRHPMATAKAVATLDSLSGGRAILGVGAGHVADEFAMLGVDFERRGAILDEAIDVVKAALEEEFPSASGPRFPVHDMGQRPRPVQSPRPPVWVGGSAPPSLRRAAERGDGWLPQGTPRAQMPEQIAFIRERREKAGLGDAPFAYGTIAEFMYIGQPDWDVGAHCLTGSADELAASLREFADLGVSHAQVRFRSRSCTELLDQIAAFGAEVAPLLAS